MEDWDAPKHQWPSQELVLALATHVPDNPKGAIVRAVWNSIGQFRSVAHMIEGGYLPMADNEGNLHHFFSDYIYPAIKLSVSGGPSAAFGRLILRDLTAALSMTGEPYGPEGYQSAYLALDSRGQLQCIEDMPGHKRRSFGAQPQDRQLKAA